MLKNVRKTDSIVGSFESVVELVKISDIVKLLRNEVLDLYITNLGDDSDDTYTAHKVALGRKIKVANYETEDFYNDKTIHISNKYSLTVQNIIVNICQLGMIYDLYTMLLANDYISNNDYVSKLECIKKGIILLFNSVRTVDNKDLEEFYGKYKDYVTQMTDVAK